MLMLESRSPGLDPELLLITADRAFITTTDQAIDLTETFGELPSAVV
jgi:hypothetical protein